MEVLLSTAIIALLAGIIALGGFRVLSTRWQGRAAAAQVMGVLRQAKWRAITEGREYAVDFPRPEGKAWQARLLRRSMSWIPVESPRPLPPAVSSLIVTGSARKEFNPDGTCSSGSVILTCAGEATYRIGLTTATARIRLYREGN